MHHGFEKNRKFWPRVLAFCNATSMFVGVFVDADVLFLLPIPFLLLFSLSNLTEFISSNLEINFLVFDTRYLSVLVLNFFKAALFMVVADLENNKKKSIM